MASCRCREGEVIGYCSACGIGVCSNCRRYGDGEHLCIDCFDDWENDDEEEMDGIVFFDDT